MSRLIQVYHVQFEKIGNGPVCDTLEEALEEIRDRLIDEPQNASIIVEVWPKKRYDNLPEFQGY